MLLEKGNLSPFLSRRFYKCEVSSSSKMLFLQKNPSLPILLNLPMKLIYKDYFRFILVKLDKETFIDLSEITLILGRTYRKLNSHILS